MRCFENVGPLLWCIHIYKDEEEIREATAEELAALEGSEADDVPDDDDKDEKDAVIPQVRLHR